MNEYKIYAAGKFVKSHVPLQVFNPYTNQVSAETFLAGKDELEESILAALKAENAMKELPSYKKYEILMAIASGIKEERGLFASIITREAGKPLKYAFGEVDRAIQTFIVAAEESRRLPGEYFSVDWTPAGEGKEGIVKHFPVGLIAGISPFNFPLNLAVHKIAPAIAAGNPIILKPSRSTPISALELARVLDKTMLPKGALSVLPMDRQAGNQLVTDGRFKMLTFTGSPDVGWKMKSQAGKKKVTLELGGNAAAIITESADVEPAVKKCITGGYAYSGQVCIHLQRIYVQKNVFSCFVENFIEQTQKLKFGDPAAMDTDISVMIDNENADRVEEWIQEAIAGGAKLLCGGSKKGGYVEPTVITGTKRDMKVCALEVFGPVVVVEPYNVFDEAVCIVNDSEFGLQAGVFTESQKEINYAFNNIEAGGVIINDAPTFRVDHMPYGGIKNSGFGREGVKYAIFEMSEPRLLIKNCN